MNNLVIDLIIRIKNAYMTKNQETEVMFSGLNEEILKKLVQLGYVKNYKVDRLKIDVVLVYTAKNPALTDVKIYSKPGRRIYTPYKKLSLVMGGLGYSLLSTSQGVLTNKEAREKKVGGELLFSIW